MKKFLFVLAAFLTASVCFSAEYTNINLEAEIQIKPASANPSVYAWRDVIFVDVEVEEGSTQDYKARSYEVRKGYTNFELMQLGGNSIKIDPKGKELTFKPGKVFSINGGIIWLSFTAPDKNNYKIPTNLKIVPQKDAPPLQEEVIEEVAEEIVYKSSEPLLEEPSFEEKYFVRGEDSYPDNGFEECAYVDISKQLPEKNDFSNEQVVVKNLPDGTRAKLFLMDNKEVLVYLAPDLTLKQGANSYTLFYAARRAGKDEPFSAPKRVLENPKINGKLCNIPEFTGEVFTGNGKKRLVLVWTQLTKQITEDSSLTELCRTTAVYSCSLVDDANMKWEKPEVVAEVNGTMQYHPELYNTGKNLSLCFTSRTDTDFFTREINSFFPDSYKYFVYDRNNKWKSTNGNNFVKLRSAYQFTDKNSVIPESYEFVFDKDKNINGVVYSSEYVDEDDGQTYVNCFAKTYVKSPDTKKMIWTESVPIVFHNKADKVLYPYATVRPTGEWLLTYLNATEEGNNLCVARVNVEPCLVTKKMIPNLSDMEHPNGSVRFMVEIRNEGLAIAEGCDVIVKNEQNTEAGKITEKKAIYPGTSYVLPSVYAKLKGKDGVVPVEKIKADVKPLKAVANSKFAINKATYTMGIPHFIIGDIFVRTKGFAQTLFFTVGTTNGVKVKAPGVEAVLNENYGEGFDEKTETVPIDYDISDDYYLVEYAYLTGDFVGKEFDVSPHVHFSEKSRHLPQYTKDEIEEMTSCSSQIKIYNPLLTRKCVSGDIISTSFTKKTKVMNVEFVVMNNWPEMVEGKAELKLLNVTAGVIEQTITVPYTLEVMKAQKIKCAFAPAETELETDYSVVIDILKEDEDVISEEEIETESETENSEQVLETEMPAHEGEQAKTENTASESERSEIEVTE